MEQFVVEFRDNIKQTPKTGLLAYQKRWIQQVRIIQHPTQLVCAQYQPSSHHREPQDVVVVQQAHLVEPCHILLGIIGNKHLLVSSAGFRIPQHKYCFLPPREMRVGYVELQLYLPSSMSWQQCAHKHLITACCKKQQLHWYLIEEWPKPPIGSSNDEGKNSGSLGMGLISFKGNLEYEKSVKVPGLDCSFWVYSWMYCVSLSPLQEWRGCTSIQHLPIGARSHASWAEWWVPHKSDSILEAKEWIAVDSAVDSRPSTYAN